MTITIQDKQKAVMISLAAGALETVLVSEKPGSFRRNKLTAAADYMRKATDDYTGPGFQGPDMEKATKLIEDFARKVIRTFSPPKTKSESPRTGNVRLRGRDGRFMKS